MLTYGLAVQSFHNLGLECVLVGYTVYLHPYMCTIHTPTHIGDNPPPPYQSDRHLIRTLKPQIYFIDTSTWNICIFEPYTQSHPTSRTCHTSYDKPLYHIQIDVKQLWTTTYFHIHKSSNIDIPISNMCMYIYKYALSQDQVNKSKWDVITIPSGILIFNIW